MEDIMAKAISEEIWAKRRQEEKVEIQRLIATILQRNGKDGMIRFTESLTKIPPTGTCSYLGFTIEEFLCYFNDIVNEVLQEQKESIP